MDAKSEGENLKKSSTESRMKILPPRPRKGPPHTRPPPHRPRVVRVPTSSSASRKPRHPPPRQPNLRKRGPNLPTAQRQGRRGRRGDRRRKRPRGEKSRGKKAKACFRQ